MLKNTDSRIAATTQQAANDSAIVAMVNMQPSARRFGISGLVSRTNRASSRLLIEHNFKGSSGQLVEFFQCVVARSDGLILALLALILVQAVLIFDAPNVEGVITALFATLLIAVISGFQRKEFANRKVAFARSAPLHSLWRRSLGRLLNPDNRFLAGTRFAVGVAPVLTALVAAALRKIVVRLGKFTARTFPHLNPTFC